MALDRFEPGALQILLQLLRCRANRDVIGALRDWEATMGLENRPAAFAAKVDIIDVEPAAGTKNAQRFLDIGITSPAFEMHENDRAINEIDRGIGNRAKVVAGQLDEFDVSKLAQPLGGKSEHVRRDVGPNPAPAAPGQALADPADPAADFEDDVGWVKPDFLAL